MAIVRKSDRVIQVTVTGGNGTPVTISTLADLEVLTYQFPKRIIHSSPPVFSHNHVAAPTDSLYHVALTCGLFGIEW